MPSIQIAILVDWFNYGSTTPPTPGASGSPIGLLLALTYA